MNDATHHGTTRVQSWCTKDGQSTDQQQRSLPWLAMVVALAIMAIMILGTNAEDRWCGSVLCSDQIETY
jgi:hypothetical protein